MQGVRVPEQSVRVLVADGTRIHTQLLFAALKQNPTLEVFEPSPDFAQIVETAVHKKIDIVVIASRLGDEPLGGLEILRKICQSRSKVRGVVLLDSIKTDTILGAFRAGARGLFSRDASLETLSECVRKVHAGEIWATSEQMVIALEALTAVPSLRSPDSNGLSALSKRELDVVLSLAEGLSNREIAGRLGLSQHTVKNYLFRVFDKLGVSSRIELLFLALNHQMPNKLAFAAEEASAAGSTFTSMQQAASSGIPTAQLALAVMYAEGTAVSRDPLVAYMWYLICERTLAEMKDFISAEKRKIAGLLDTDEILQAQKMAADHLKKPVKTALENHSRRASAISAG